MTPLETALAAYTPNPGFASLSPELDRYWEQRSLILAAARSVVEGETIWWCGAHGCTGFAGYDYCHLFAEEERSDGGATESCRMVEKVLADPT